MIAGCLFLALLAATLAALRKMIWRDGAYVYTAPLFWLLAVMLFGLLEYCWGDGSITILTLYMTIGIVMHYAQEEHQNKTEGIKDDYGRKSE